MNEKIFIVEDESIVSLELRDRLIQLGYNVVGDAATGESALAKIKESYPHLVLMDIMLKGEMDGIDTALKLKEFTDIPVIFLTAYADDSTIQRAKTTAPYGYIIKPFEERELASAIEIALYKYKTEKVISQKDRFLGTILKSIGEAVIAVDNDGIITYMNKTAEKLTGYDADSSIGQDLGSVIHFINEFTSDGSEHGYKEEFERWRSFDFYDQTGLITKSGVLLPIDDYSAPILDKDGSIIGVLLVFRDLTDTKKARERLYESERKFRELVENSPQLLYLFSTEKGIEYISPRVTEILGYSQADFDENPGLWARLIHPADSQNYALAIRNIIGEGSTQIQYRLKDISGKWKWINDRVKLIKSSNDHLVVQGFASDITEQKSAEEKISLQQSALDSAYNGIIITDRKGTIIYANNAIERLTGYSKEEVIGSNPKIFNSGKQSVNYYFKMWRTILSGETWFNEIINKKKDGTLYYEENSITPVKNSEGDITHFISIKQDVTERKSNEMQLVEAKEEAEKSDRLKSEFLAQMSHEIRTPINSILSFTNLVRSEIEDKIDDDLKISFDMINQGSKRLIRTVDLILNMSAIQTKTYQSKFRNIRVKEEVIKPVIDEFKSYASVKGLQLTLIDKVESEIELVADEYSLSQIFVNLIENAIKYTKAGSIIVSVELSSKDNFTISIQDTGIGISNEYLSKLFEPFSQEDQGYTRRFEGNGLGLALVKNYCNINRAEIFVESEKGVGSKFTVKFTNFKISDQSVTNI